MLIVRDSIYRHRDGRRKRARRRSDSVAGGEHIMWHNITNECLSEIIHKGDNSREQSYSNNVICGEDNSNHEAESYIKNIEHSYCWIWDRAQLLLNINSRLAWTGDASAPDLMCYEEGIPSPFLVSVPQLGIIGTRVGASVLPKGVQLLRLYYKIKFLAKYFYKLFLRCVFVVWMENFSQPIT